jgi:hypothetical protein
VEFVVIDGEGGVDFSGDAWRGPNEGIGVVRVLGVIVRGLWMLRSEIAARHPQGVVLPFLQTPLESTA